MTQLAYFNLPDVGEGLTEAEIVSWKVAVGDQVSVNQIIVEIETAKSLVELPCPFAGVVAELLAAEGDTVEVGKPIIACKVADGATGAVATQAIPVIDPAVAAAAASAHEAVAEAAAIGLPHEVKGTGIHCFVILRAGIDGTTPARRHAFSTSSLQSVDELGPMIRSSPARTRSMSRSFSLPNT